MKHYNSYMDRVQVSAELHGTLLNLEPPKKTARRPVRAKYGALAACAALLIGAAALGIIRHNDAAWQNLVGGRFHPYGGGPTVDGDPVPCAAPTRPADMEAIDLAPVDGDDIVPGMKTIPGYEVQENRAGIDVVVYHVLPYIEYGNAAAGQVAADWDIPSGATRRDLTTDEITALLGGGDAVSTHLDWSGYELTGWAAWYEDGSFWGAYLHGYAGPLDHFEFAVTAGQLPPTCIVFPDSVEQEIWGVTVTADKYDGQNGCDRRVSFMKDGFGYRFDLTSTDGAEAAEKLVSRAVRRMTVDGGIASDAVTPDGLAPANPDPAASRPAENPEIAASRPPMAAASPSMPPQEAAQPAPSVGPGA